MPKRGEGLGWFRNVTDEPRTPKTLPARSSRPSQKGGCFLFYVSSTTRNATTSAVSFGVGVYVSIGFRRFSLRSAAG